MPSDAGMTGLHPGPAMWWRTGRALPAADSDSNGEVGLNWSFVHQISAALLVMQAPSD